MAGQTINIMTLSGLALAIGILVDEATVTIENIHQHLEMGSGPAGKNMPPAHFSKDGPSANRPQVGFVGKTKRQAVYDACMEISFAKLLILLCILAVFAPSFVMTGVPRAMFLPLSMAIGFAMIVAFLASQTLVPVISVWLLKAEMFQGHHKGAQSHAVQVMDEAEKAELAHHRAEEALPLVGDHLLAGHARAGTQPAVPQRLRGTPRRGDHPAMDPSHVFVQRRGLIQSRSVCLIGEPECRKNPFRMG